MNFVVLTFDLHVLKISLIGGSGGLLQRNNSSSYCNENWLIEFHTSERFSVELQMLMAQASRK